MHSLRHEISPLLMQVMPISIEDQGDGIDDGHNRMVGVVMMLETKAKTERV